MNDITLHKPSPHQQLQRNRRRQFADIRFRAYGILGLTLAAAALLFLLFNIFSTGFDAFRQTAVSLDFNLDRDVLGINIGSADTGNTENLAGIDTLRVVKLAIYEIFPQVQKRKDKRLLHKILSTGAELELQDYLRKNPQAIGTVITLTVPQVQPV
jgi:phosphate transport system permease protein